MATVPALTTQAAGGVAAAAWANSVRDAIAFFTTTRPRFTLRQTVAQSFTNGTFTPLTWDVEDRDNDGGHSTVSNTDRYTAQTAGDLLVGGAAVWVLAGAGAGSIRVARLTLNGTVINGTTTTFTSGSLGSHSAVIRPTLVTVAVGDILRLEGRQDSGAALLTAVVSGDQSTLTGIWVGS